MQVAPGKSCVSRDVLAAEVASWLGKQTVPAAVSVRVQGSPDDPRAVSFVLLQGAEVRARRAFAPAPARCEALHETLGIAIALAMKASLIDESAGQRTQDAWQVGALLLAGVGLAPRPTLGGGLRVARRLPRAFAIESAVLARGARDIGFARAPGSFALRWLGLRVAGCSVLELRARLRGSGCVGFRASALWSAGEGYTRALRSVLMQLAVDGALGLDLTVRGPWSLGATAAFVLPLGRTRFQVRTLTTDTSVDRRALPAFGGELSLGPSYRF